MRRSLRAAGVPPAAAGGSTTPELLSLLSRTPHGEDFCVESAFDYRQTAFWSADRRSFTAAWFVDVAMGFAGWQDFSAQVYVRAVAG